MVISSVGSVENACTSDTQGLAVKLADSLQDQFMQILLTQLRYQDPMEPLQEKDFFAQVAQFTTASQLATLNQNLSGFMDSVSKMTQRQLLLGAACLVGHEFEAESYEGIVRGIVDAVALKDGQVVIRSGDKEVPLENVTFIGGLKNADQAR